VNYSEIFDHASVLVTGAAGFIGGHLATALSRTVCRLTLVDSADGLSRVALHGTARVAMQPLDILDPAFPKLISAERFDYIFHFAGNANVAASVTDPARDFEVNLRASVGMLEAIRQSSCESAVIYASSAAVYGNPVRLPIREEDATVPVSPYGVGKLALERYLSVYCRLYGVRGASLRMFSPFGPRLRKQIVFELMKKLATDPSHLTVFGDGSESRDFIYVDDLISAILCVAAQGAMDGAVYNIGRGVQTPVSEIAENLATLAGGRATIAYEGRAMPGYPNHWCADVTRLSDLGWKPLIPLDEGLRRTLEWFRVEYP
jgi:UDP-glucose 4-epimerase